MKSGVFWRLTVDCRPMFPPILDEALVGRRFLCRNNQVKSFVERSSFFHDFLIGKASGDGRPMIDKHSADFGRKLQFETGRTSPAHRVSMLNCISIW